MPRPPNIIRPTRLTTYIPEDVRAWLDLHLFSISEQRVPLGAYQRLIVRLLRDYRSKVENVEHELAVAELTEGSSDVQS